jgi:hypothetical protein
MTLIEAGEKLLSFQEFPPPEICQEIYSQARFPFPNQTEIEDFAYATLSCVWWNSYPSDNLDPHLSQYRTWDYNRRRIQIFVDALKKEKGIQMVKTELFIVAADPSTDGNIRVLAQGQIGDEKGSMQLVLNTKDTELVKNMQAGKTLNVQLTVKSGSAVDPSSEEGKAAAGPAVVGSGLPAPVANDATPRTDLS